MMVSMLEKMDPESVSCTTIALADYSAAIPATSWSSSAAISNTKHKN